MMLIEAASYHGRGLDAMVAAFDVQGLYGDGMNLYAYLGSNPWMRSDPLGLSWDPFDMVDEYLAEDAGSKAAFMQSVMGGFDTIWHVTAQIAQLHPAVAAAVAVFQLANGGPLTIARLLSIIPGGKVLGVLGRAFSSYSKGRHALRGARAFGDDVLELHHVVPQFMLGWRSSGRVVTMTRREHDEYHRLLDRILSDRGMPVSYEGVERWRQWLRNNPGRGDDVRVALVESVEQFKDATDGRHDLMGDLWIEMTRQQWMMGM